MNAADTSKPLRILGIIPARYASTRFPGKPLVEINGKTMINRTYEQALSCKSLSKVVVATDDMRIAEEVEKFGGSFAMTSDQHQSGTDRCAEVAASMTDFDVIINIQGDEPFINPEQIELLANCFKEPSVKIATLIKKIHTEQELFNVNIPKVVFNTNADALYFSRHPVPFLRNTEEKDWINQHQYYKHIGIYGYLRKTLLDITKINPSSLETAESLEQLRWLENGYAIRTAVTDLETLAIDTPEDLKKIKL